MIRVLVLLVTLSLIACGAPPELPSGMSMPRHRGFGDGGPGASVEGTLVERDGCLFVLDPASGAETLIVWPLEGALTLVDGDLVVRIGNGAARVGDAIRMGGSFFDDGVLLRARLVNSFPDRCATPSVVLVTGFDVASE